ncbi:hypothetical protein BKA62DRAFT_253202 [Auriculariales sp. MPI-PUGE-AT-0066]|nr:hypothetical protein BKA62DRAFT_253202 [Auriculariales sp. MPI-PUGE-AT-0066]
MRYTYALLFSRISMLSSSWLTSTRRASPTPSLKTMSRRVRLRCASCAPFAAFYLLVAPSCVACFLEVEISPVLFVEHPTVYAELQVLKLSYTWNIGDVEANSHPWDCQHILLPHQLTLDRWHVDVLVRKQLLGSVLLRPSHIPVITGHDAKNCFLQHVPFHLRDLAKGPLVHTCGTKLSAERSAPRHSRWSDLSQTQSRNHLLTSLRDRQMLTSSIRQHPSSRHVQSLCVGS